MENMIELDQTLFIQLGTFLIALVVLNFLLIKPIREQIAARSAFIQGYMADIERFSTEASAKISSYESELSQAREDAGRTREALKAEGAAKEQQLLQAAHSEAQAFIKASKEQVAKDSEAAMKTLLSQVNDYAAKAMSKILK